jgi:hypothetical protein
MIGISATSRDLVFGRNTRRGEIAVFGSQADAPLPA